MKPMRYLLAMFVCVSSAFAEEPKRDRFGDSLPAGVVRLGTLRHRIVPGTVMSFLPDGKTLRAIDPSLTVTEYDAADGRILRAEKLQDLPPAGTQAQRILLSRDGNVVAAQLSTGIISVWDVRTKKHLRALRKAGYAPQQLAISDDGRSIATTAYAAPVYELRAWNVASGESKLIGDHKNSLMLPTFFPDGKQLAAFSDFKLKCWDIATGKETWGYSPKNGNLNETLGIPIHDKTILLQDFQQFQILIRLNVADGVHESELKIAGKGPIAWIQFVNDNRAFVCRQGTPRAMLYDLKAGKEILSLPDVAGVLAFAPDRKSFIGAYAGWTTLQRWDLTTGKPLWGDTRDIGHTGDVYRLAFSPDGRTLASSSEDGTVRIWDVKSQRIRQVIREHPRGTWAMAFSADSRFHFTTSRNEVIQWSTDDGKEVRRFKHGLKSKPGSYVDIRSVAASPDGDLYALMSLSDGNGIRESAILMGWGIASAKEKFRREEAFRGYSAALSPNGAIYTHVAGKILDTPTGRQRASLSIPEGMLISVVVSPQFAYSASEQIVVGQLGKSFRTENRMGTNFHGLQAWDALTGRPLRTFGEGLLGVMAISPDGRLLAAGDTEYLHVWDTLTGEELIKKPAEGRTRGNFRASFVSAMAFSPDGRTLATSFSDSTILLWEMPRPKSRPAADPKAALADLGSEDPAKAWAAVWGLAASKEAMPLLREAIKPAPAIPPEKIKALLADLESQQFTRREAASKMLASRKEQLEPALREALKGELSAEKRRRLESLVSSSYGDPTPEVLRYLRGVQVLEIVATGEAKNLLRELAKGDPAARETKAARAAVARIEHGP